MTDSFVQFEHTDFAVQVPADWILVPSPQFEAVFVVPPFPEGSGANISVAIIPSEDQTSLPEIADALKATQEGSYPHYHVIAEDLLELGHTMAFRRVYTWVNTVQDLPILQIQLVFVDDSGHTGAVVTGTRPQYRDDPEPERLDHALHAAAMSFELK